MKGLENMSNAEAIIFDIDGTLADCSHRLPFIAAKPKDWDGFFGALADDTIIEPVRRLLDAVVVRGGYGVIICSGRPETYREATEAWLARHGIKWDRLYMRKAGDRRDDQIVKRELLAEMRRDQWKPFLAIDDRQRVVDMWRSEGIVCLQCAPGDF